MNRNDVQDDMMSQYISPVKNAINKRRSQG